MAIIDLGPLGRQNITDSTFAALDLSIEEGLEDGLRNVSAGNFDPNSTLKSVLHKLVHPTSKTMQFFRNQGVRHASNAIALLVAHKIESNVDKLWPHRKDSGTQVLRLVLGALAPTLRIAAQAGMDFTKHLNDMDDRIDELVTSSAHAPASRTAQMDELIIIESGALAGMIFTPERDAAGLVMFTRGGEANGGSPLSADARYMRALRQHEQDHPATTRTTNSGRRGSGSTTTVTKGQPFSRLVPVEEAARFYLSATPDAATTQLIMDALKPKPSVHWWDRQTDDTRQKIVAIQLTRTRFSERIPEGLGQRMDEEDLATSLQKSGAPPSMVHDFLVPVNIDGDGCVSAQDLEHFWHASDTWLGANQSTATQTVKGFDLVVKKLKGFGIRGTSLSWLLASMVGLGGFLLLLYLGTLVSLFVIALLSLAVSVFLPMEMVLPFSFGPFTDARSVAQVCATMAGWINFAVVLLLQLFGSQMGSFYHGARSFFDDEYKPPAPEAETGFKSVIQKLRIFGFFLAGTLFVLISLDGPVSYRLAWVTVVVGLMIASGSIQVDAGDRDGLRERIIKSVPKFEFIFVVLPAAWILGTLVVEKIVSWFSTNLIANAQSWLSDPWHLAFAVIGVMGLVGAVLSYLQRDKQKNTNTGFQGWGLIVALGLFALLAAWWNTTTVFDGWFEDDTPTAAQTVPAASAPVTQPRPQSTRQPSEREKRAERQRKCDTKALSYVTCVDLYNKGKIDRHP
jgi:hypothetical protein